MCQLSFFFRIVLFLYFFGCLQLSLWASTSDNYLKELKKNILESQYIFSSEISKFSSNYEVPIGQKIFLTNRVSKGRFRVAGKPVTVFFSHPQTVEPITGLKSTYLEVSNSYVYQDLTDEQGEMVFAFTPSLGQLDVNIHFTSVPKNYTEHINQIRLWVYNPQEIKFGFYSFTYLWICLFLFILLLVGGEHLPLTSHSIFLVKVSKFLASLSPLLRSFSGLFPYLTLVVPVSGREILVRQGGMILTGVLIAFLIQSAPTLLVAVMIFSFFGLRDRGISFVILSGLLLLPYIFLREFASLQSVLHYIGEDEINFLIVVTIIAASPPLLAGMATLAWLQYSGLTNSVFYFFINSTPSTSFWEQVSYSFLYSFSELFETFFFRNYFFLFLLSLTLTGFVVGYRFFSSSSTPRPKSDVI